MWFSFFRATRLGWVILIEGATGWVIGTRTGTPHQSGVMVDGGKRFGPLHVGMKGISVRAKIVGGDSYHTEDLEYLNPGDPAIFLHHFP